jgi:hypothetical protein
MGIARIYDVYGRELPVQGVIHFDNGQGWILSIRKRILGWFVGPIRSGRAGPGISIKKTLGRVFEPIILRWAEPEPSSHG